MSWFFALDLCKIDADNVAVWPTTIHPSAPSVCVRFACMGALYELFGSVLYYSVLFCPILICSVSFYSILGFSAQTKLTPVKFKWKFLPPAESSFCVWLPSLVKVGVNAVHVNNFWISNFVLSRGTWRMHECRQSVDSNSFAAFL